MESVASSQIEGGTFKHSKREWTRRCIEEKSQHVQESPNVFFKSSWQQELNNPRTTILVRLFQDCRVVHGLCLMCNGRFENTSA